MSSLTRSPIIGPIIRDRARRPVARDSNGRSLTRQLFRVFRRPFPTFLDPAHDSVPLSGLHYRVLHGIRSQVLCLSRTRPPGSLLAQRQLQYRAINTIRLGREGGRDDTTCVLGSLRRPLSQLLDGRLLLSTLRLASDETYRTRTVLVATIANVIILTPIQENKACK